MLLQWMLSLLMGYPGIQNATDRFPGKEANADVVKQSWTQIKDSLGGNGPETVGRLIFENLFKEFPYTVNFFTNYGSNAEEIMANEKFMWHAKDRVFVTFDEMISNLGNEEKIKSIASWITKVHDSKGVKPTDFLNFGTAIVKTVEQALGNNLTPEIRVHWLRSVTDLMKGIANIKT